MATYSAEIIWQRGDQHFLDKRYSRRHLIKLDGGLEIPASSSPHVVPLPYSDAAAADPEELMVAALANCHMLFFLSIAARNGYRVDSYADSATGSMTKNGKGKLFLSEVKLHPQVLFSGEKIPSPFEIESMHHEAHEECFIANSVITRITCTPLFPEENKTRGKLGSD